MSEAEYPTLGFDPAPGVAGSVKDLAGKLSAAVGGLERARSTLMSIAKAGGAGVWEGEAATAFSKQVGDLPRYLTDSHDALKSAAGQLSTWHGRLVEYQATARRYEAEAKAAKHRQDEGERTHDRQVTLYDQAASDPDFQLAGRPFATEAEAKAAQGRIDAAGVRLRDAGTALDAATDRLTTARDDLNAIVKKAKDLLDHHQAEARTIAGTLRKAEAKAPDASFWDKLGDHFKKLGHDIKDWCTTHADLLKTIGDWMGTASAVLGVAALATMWCPPLAGGLALAGGIAAGGALAAHGAAKLGGADVGWTTLALDGLGAVPPIKFGFTALSGAKVGTKFTKNGALMLKSKESVEQIVRGTRGAIRPIEDASPGLTRLTGAKNATQFEAKGLSFANRARLAWHVNATTFSQGTLEATGLSGAFTKSPLSKIPSVASAIRADGTLDPMSWWSRGPQIGQKLRGAWEKADDAIHSDIPAAASLG